MLVAHGLVDLGRWPLPEQAHPFFVVLRPRQLLLMQPVVGNGAISAAQGDCVAHHVKFSAAKVLFSDRRPVPKHGLSVCSDLGRDDVVVDVIHDPTLGHAPRGLRPLLIKQGKPSQVHVKHVERLRVSDRVLDGLFGQGVNHAAFGHVDCTTVGFAHASLARHHHVSRSLGADP